jgi:shikimate kinase
MAAIFITGPKHSGKTSAGKALAERLSGTFIDLDEFITRQTGKSPRALYLEGPGVFRKAEAGALAALLEAANGHTGDGHTGDGHTATGHIANGHIANGHAGNSHAAGPQVIAAGGGLIDNPEALERLKKAGTALVVNLEVSAETAWNRIARSAEKEGLPPFLKAADPQAAHRALHERRARAYREWASFTVTGEAKSPEAIAEEIAELLQVDSQHDP